MQKPVAGWHYTVKVEQGLGCEACAQAYLNTERGTYVGCAKHPAMSIDPVVASVLAAEKRRDSYQQAVYELATLGEIRNSGFSRAWKVEYASRDLGSAMQRAIAELDAAGIIDLDATRSTPEVAARTIIALVDKWIAPMRPAATLDQDGNVVTDPAFAAELRINRQREGRDLRTGKFQLSEADAVLA